MINMDYKFEKIQKYEQKILNAISSYDSEKNLNDSSLKPELLINAAGANLVTDTNVTTDINSTVGNNLTLHKNSSYISLLKENIYSGSNIKRYECCPYCGSKKIIKFGKYQNIQRYRCKNQNCRKTFSNTTNSIWKYSKLNPEKWMKYIEIMFEGNTLEYAANRLDISIVTAFNWRHKILHAIENTCKVQEFKDVVHIITYTRGRCFKGSRNKHFTHKQKLENRFRKLYCRIRRDIKILISKDNQNMPLIRTTMPGEHIKDIFLKNVSPILGKDCYTHPDGSNELDLIRSIIECNKKISRKTKKKYDVHIRNSSLKIELKDNIDEDKGINKFIEQLRTWELRFKGIASKYINHYYNFYSLISCDKVFTSIDIFFDLLKRGSYMSVNTLKQTHIENY